MRLDRYLVEVRKKEPSIDITPYLDTIEKECSKILRVYKQADAFLYRGVNEKGKFLEKKGRTKVRVPRDTPIEYHRFLNKIFLEKMGWKVRDGISTTPQRGWASFYGMGHTYIFLPTDKYKFAWSPKYGDLWNDLKILKTFVVGSTKEFLEKKRSTFVRAVNTYDDTDLVRGIKVGLKGRVGEIMFKVGKYYLLRWDSEDDLRIALGMGPGD
jgi:hypothetical protein